MYDISTRSSEPTGRSVVPLTSNIVPWCMPTSFLSNGGFMVMLYVRLASVGSTGGLLGMYVELRGIIL